MEFDIFIEHFAEKKNLQVLQELSHISEQWSTLMSPKMSRCCPHLSLIAKRASMRGNAADSCERENSKIARYKDKLSSSMGVSMMRARSRVGSNGPPIHKFDVRESVRFWIEKGHQHAQTKTEKFSKVIDQKKKRRIQSTLLRFLQNLFMHIDGFQNATKCWDF